MFGWSKSRSRLERSGEKLANSQTSTAVPSLGDAPPLTGSNAVSELSTVPLTALQQLVAQDIDQPDGTIPPLFTKLLRYLNSKGSTMPDLFFVSLASNEEMNDLRRRFVSEQTRLQLGSVRDPRMVASLLIEYLEALPEPLLTYRLYDAFVLADTICSDRQRLAYVHRVFHTDLPRVLRQCMKTLLALLGRVLSCHRRGGVENEKGVCLEDQLAARFVHSLLRPIRPLPYQVQDLKVAERVLSMMITRHESLLRSERPANPRRLTLGAEDTVASRPRSSTQINLPANILPRLNLLEAGANTNTRSDEKSGKVSKSSSSSRISSNKERSRRSARSEKRRSKRKSARPSSQFPTKPPTPPKSPLVEKNKASAHASDATLAKDIEDQVQALEATTKPSPSSESLSSSKNKEEEITSSSSETSHTASLEVPEMPAQAEQETVPEENKEPRHVEIKTDQHEGRVTGTSTIEKEPLKPETHSVEPVSLEPVTIEPSLKVDSAPNMAVDEQSEKSSEKEKQETEGTSEAEKEFVLITSKGTALALLKQLTDTVRSIVDQRHLITVSRKVREATQLVDGELRRLNISAQTVLDHATAHNLDQNADIPAPEDLEGTMSSVTQERIKKLLLVVSQGLVNLQNALHYVSLCKPKHFDVSLYHKLLQILVSCMDQIRDPHESNEMVDQLKKEFLQLAEENTTTPMAAESSQIGEKVANTTPRSSSGTTIEDVQGALTVLEERMQLLASKLEEASKEDTIAVARAIRLHRHALHSFLGAHTLPLPSPSASRSGSFVNASDGSSSSSDKESSPPKDKLTELKKMSSDGLHRIFLYLSTLKNVVHAPEESVPRQKEIVKALGLELERLQDIPLP